MVSLRKRFRFGGLLGATTLLAACGGGVTDPLSDSALKLIGKAVVGQLSSGSVSAYAINEDGSNGPLLGTGQTDGNGEFDVTLTSKPSGGVRLVVNGGSYASPANTTTTVHDTSLSAVLSALSVTGASGVVVSPFTSFADPLLVSLLSSAGSLSAAQTQAEGVIKTSYGIQSTNPLASLAPDFTATSGDSAKLALVLGALEQLAITNGKTPNEIFHAIGEDITDGLFDGKTTGGAAIRYSSGGATAPVTLANDQFLSAITQYTAPSNTATILAKNHVVLDTTTVTALQTSISAHSADTAPPTILSVSPAKNATGAAYNGAVTVSFSEPMTASTINAETFTVAGATGTVTYSGTTATFTPTGGFAGTKAYTATITTGVKDAAGNPLASAYTWTFTTGVIPDTTPPTVTSTTPANNATGIALNAAITATFSETMTASTINATNFTVDGVAGTVSYTGNVATFKPTLNLANNTTYTAQIGTGTKDAAGNGLASNYSWTFKTKPAAAGALDTSFNGTGKVITPSPSYAFNTVKAIALQSDGKIVAVGPDCFHLARYNLDGSLDTGFGSGGIIGTEIKTDNQFCFGSANAVTIQPADGKIVVAGTAGLTKTVIVLARYEGNGSLDTTFGAGGILTTAIGDKASAQAVAVQSDGKIVAAGNTTSSGASGYGFAIARYNSDGNLDASFGTAGIVKTFFSTASKASAIALQPDQKIIVVGSSDRGYTESDFALARYNTDGSLDVTFDADGKVNTSFNSGFYTTANAVVIQPSDGKIVVVGTSALGASGSGPALARYNLDGSVDTSFGSSGKVSPGVGTNVNVANAAVIQLDGKIIVAGNSGSSSIYAGLSLTRYTSSGARDSTFGTNGKVTTVLGLSEYEDMALALAIQSDGKIVAAGNSDGLEVALVRYLP